MERELESSGRQNLDNRQHQTRMMEAIGKVSLGGEGGKKCLVTRGSHLEQCSTQFLAQPMRMSGW
jgi:hypothetical protein